MADYLSPQDLVNAKVDAKTLGEALNDDKVVKPRYGKSYDSFPLLVRKLLDNGGFRPFPNEQAIKDYVPTVTPSVAKDMSTYKLWLWDKGVWTDTGLSELERATQHANLLTKKISHIANHNGIYVRLSDGSVQKYTGTELAQFKVIENEKYYIQSSSFLTSSFCIAFRRTDSIKVGDTDSHITIKDINEDEVGKYVIVPADAEYMLINTIIPLQDFNISDSLHLSISAITEIDGVEIKDKHAVNLADLIETESEMQGLNEYNKDTIVSGMFINLNDGLILQNSSLSMAGLKVQSGVKYYVESKDYDKYAFCIAFRKTISNATGATDSHITIKDINEDEVGKYVIVPADAEYMLINVLVPSSGFDIRDSLKVFRYLRGVHAIGSAPVVDLQARQDLKAIQNTLDVGLAGIWVAVGDSITEKNFRANKNYHDFITDRNQNLSVYNYGKSGTGYKDRYNVADTIIQENPELITVFFGTNDWGLAKIDLGEFLDNGVETISGRINTTLLNLITKFPLAVIAVFTPLPRLSNWGSNASKNANGYTLEQLSELVIKYAKHYSLPHLDLYHESNLPVWIDAANKFFFTAPNQTQPDGLHPNDAGQERMSFKIESFLKSII